MWLMLAALYTGLDAPLSVEQVDPLPPGPRDVVVRILASGVCHSDLLVTKGAVGFVAPPSVLGHEGAGVVEEVGSHVEGLRPGDTVIGSVILTCGQCFYCHAGEPNLCHEALNAGRVPRVVRADGAKAAAGWGLGTFAEAMTVDERSLVKVVTDLPYEQLALIGCSVSTGVGAVLNTARVPAGATVAVLGCGGVGMAVVQGARLAGALRIIAIDPVADKRAYVLSAGATDAVDPADGDVVEQVRELTVGMGVDFAFEAVGLPATITQSFDMIRRGGTAVIIGQAAADATVTFPAQALRSGSRSIVGCGYGSVQPRRDFQRFVDFAAAGRLDLGSLISHRIPMREINNAFASLERGGEIRRTVIV